MSSEYREDEAVLRHIPNFPNGGFYVDLGCAWPNLYSNTEFLRKRGWNGLAVDGNPAYAENWNGVAPFVCAVMGDGEDVSFEYNPAADLSRIGHGTTVKSVRLDELTKDIEKIDFISCDLEGHEYEALSRLDWNKHRPKVIVSEYNTAGKGTDFRVHKFLTDMGYNEIFMTIANHVFVWP